MLVKQQRRPYYPGERRRTGRQRAAAPCEGLKKGKPTQTAAFTAIC